MEFDHSVIVSSKTSCLTILSISFATDCGNLNAAQHGALCTGHVTWNVVSILCQALNTRPGWPSNIFGNAYIVIIRASLCSLWPSNTVTSARQSFSNWLLFLLVTCACYTICCSLSGLRLWWISLIDSQDDWLGDYGEGSSCLLWTIERRGNLQLLFAWFLAIFLASHSYWWSVVWMVDSETYS